MYRQYENPYRLEEWLSELNERRVNADEIMYLDDNINERINFAWQDEQFLKPTIRGHYS